MGFNGIPEVEAGNAIALYKVNLITDVLPSLCDIEYAIGNANLRVRGGYYLSLEVV